MVCSKSKQKGLRYNRDNAVTNEEYMRGIESKTDISMQYYFLQIIFIYVYTVQYQNLLNVLLIYPFIKSIIFYNYCFEMFYITGYNINSNPSRTPLTPSSSLSPSAKILKRWSFYGLIKHKSTNKEHLLYKYDRAFNNSVLDSL